MESHTQVGLTSRRSPSEEVLSRIFAEVLRVPSVETGANFFDIGGDSLKAMEVIVRVGEVLHVELPLIAFFEGPTVTHLAAVADELKGTASALPITRIPGRREFPLSYSQQVFWLLDQQNAGTGVYNTTRIFRIRGSVDANLLERSLNELRRRNEILQVRFVQGVDGPVQVVDPGELLKLAVTDLRRLESGEREEAARKVALATVREQFDLNRGPLLRAHLVRLNNQDGLLCMAVHHAVSDGFTGSILLDELGTIYDAFASGEPNPLPELDLHFTDYAAWEYESITDSHLEADLAYWRSVLQGAPASVDLPTDHARPPELHRTGRLRSVTVSGESLRLLQELARSNGATLFTVLAASLRILLSRWSGQGDFLLGTIASNRSRSGTERMMGCFVNPLPLRNLVQEGQSALDVLKKEANAIMDAFAHQDCPFAKIVEAINPERTDNDNPLFNVALLLQNFPAIAYKGRHFRAEYEEFDAEVGLLDLRFVALETNDGLRVSCEYKSELFTEGTVDVLLRAYAGVLDAVAKSPLRPVADIELPAALVEQRSMARAREHKRTVAVAASFTAQPLAEPLSFLLAEAGLGYRLAFAPYQQVFQQLFDPASILRTADGFSLVLVRLEDWLHSPSDSHLAPADQFEQLAGEFIEAVRAAQHARAPLLICFCPASHAVCDAPGWRESLDSVESRIQAACAAFPSVQVIRSHEVLDLYPVEEYEDPYAQRLGNVPYTTDFFSALGTMVTRRIWGMAENRYKVIALSVEEAQRGELQHFLRQQGDAGMLLCLCAHRDAKDEREDFDHNPGMQIGADDFVAVAAGNASASKSLEQLSRELKLGLDRFIFLHADAAECAAVEAALPEVLTLQLPAEPDELTSWLKHTWAFDRHHAEAGSRAPEFVSSQTPLPRDSQQMAESETKK
jgi:acyl carrier protein